MNSNLLSNMEKYYSQNSLSSCIKLFSLLLFLVAAHSGSAQLTGTLNIPGNYATLALAITDLNTQGVGAGGVTLNVVAGNPETAPAGGYIIGGAGSMVLTTASMANPITIQGNGNTITAFTPQAVGLLYDGIFKLIGADWVTLTGFTLTENAANTVTAAVSNDMTEWGIALLYVTTTDGCQNVTIQNNTIDLVRTYQNTFGIYCNATHAATTPSTSATATGSLGGNHGLKIYDNTIQDVNHGIVIVGPTAAADHNDGIEIGATLSNANTVTDYGSTGTFSTYANVSTTVNGILVRNSKNVDVSYNSVTSSVGGVTAGTLYGIQFPTFSAAPTGAFTNTVSNNSISLQSGAATGVMNGINLGTTSASTTSTVNVSLNDFHDFGHTVAASGAITFISQSGTHLNTSILNNTFTDLSVNTTGSVTFISNSVTRPANAICEANDNAIVTAFNKTGAGGTVTFYTSSSLTPPSGTEINSGNNFSNVTVTGATTIAGWVTNDGSTTSPFGPSRNVSNNIFSNITGGTSTVTILNVGFSNNGSSTNDVTGNEISNVSSGGTVTGMTTAGGKQNFFSNNIFTLTSSGASAVTGFSSTGGTNAAQEIFKNKIYDVSSTNAGGTVNGLLISGTSSGQTLNVYNNLIGDLRATTATGTTEVIRGINVTATGLTSTFNVSYNTVYINATSSGTNFGTAGIYHTGSTTASTAALNLRNNVIVNLSTPNGTGLTVAHKRGTVNLTNYGSSSNNNLFYAGTPGAANLIYNDNTNSDQTLAAYKTRVAPRDANSVTENPTFISTTGSSSDFLHINTSIATQIESGGINIAGITDDFDSEVRQGNGGYGGTGIAPDIGADEFEGIPADLIGPSISYVTFGNTSCLTDRTLSSTITDASGVNTAGGTKPRLYFKKKTDTNTYAGNTNADNGWKYVEATNASSPFSFTTDYTLLQSAVMMGDTIQYFVVAQDLAGTPNVNINSGTFNSPPSSVALLAGNFPITGTINSYALIAAGLSGTVTIGAAGTYPTLSGIGGLFEAINTSGMSAALTVNILDASVAETGATALNAINYNGCAAGPYSLTIKPGAGVNATLSGSSTSAIIKLNGADNVTIDGSNNGTSSKNLTIENTSTGSNTTVIWVASLGTGAGAANNTIKNSFIKAGSNSVTTTFGIYVAGTTLSTSGTGDDNDYLSIQNNTISKAYYGIYARGNSSGVNNGMNILSNTIGSSTASDYIGFRGMQIYQADGAIIEGNTIFNIINSTSNLRAIELVTGFLNSFVSKNVIYEINYTSTSNSAGKGITINTGSASSNVTISNNVVYGLKGHGSSTATNNSWGIMLEGGGGYNVYYNSVNLSDDRSSTTSVDIHGAMYVASSVTAVDLRNNILVSTAAAGNVAGKTYALYSLAANTAFTTINYNDYWATGTNRFAGFISSTDRTTLADMQAGFGQNVNSLVSDPLFNSNTNLVPQPGTPVDNAGTPIAGITTDITGFTRSVATPTIGAYEQASDLAVPSITYTALSFTCSTGDRALNGVTITDASGVPTSGSLQPRIYYKKNMNSWFSSQGTLASGTGTNGMWNFTIVAADMGGLVVGDVVSYFVIAQDIASPINITSNPSAGLVATDVNTVTTAPTTPNTYPIGPTLNGTYTVGAAGAYTTLTSAINTFNASCLSGPVIFELTDATYSGSETFPIVINAHPDASSTNTLTIRPAAGTAVTISGTSGTSAGSLIKLNGADYVNIDGLNSGGASLTIENTSVSAGTGVLWLSSNGTGQGATNNIIENTTFKAGVTTNTSTIVTYGIVIAGSSLATTVASIAAGDDNDNNTFTGNTIIKARYAFISKGGSTTNPNTGTVISDNTIGPAAFGTESIGKSGILIREEDGTQITGNEIRFVGGTFATTSGGTDRIGIAFGTDASWTPTSVYVKNAVVKNNLIHDIIDERTFSAVGIAIGAADGANATNNVVANNMLYNIKANGTGGDQTVGIGLNTANGDAIVFNTLYLTGDTDPDASAATPDEDNFGISVASSSVSNPIIKDNIVFMDLTSSSTDTIRNSCINIPSAFTWGTGMSNYNDFYIDPTNVQARTGCVGGSEGVLHLTLANWQAGVSQDANSIDEEPIFQSGTDLHLAPASNVALDDLGTPVTGITTDIDGDTRDVSTPDMGADEFTPSTGLDVGITALVSPATSGCFTSTETVTVTLKNFSLTTIDFSVNNVTVTVTATGGYNSNITLTSGTLAGDGTQNVVLPATINLTSNGTYTFNASTSLAGDINPANDAMTPVNVLVSTMGGTYSIGTGQSGSGGFETVTAFVNFYNTASCFTGNVVGQLMDASYTTPAETFPLVITDNTAAGTYTLTLSPATGVAATISGTSGAVVSALIKLEGADYVTIDGLNTGGSSLTIENTSVTDGTAVIWLSSTGVVAGAQNNSIKNTTIKAGVAPNSATTDTYGVVMSGSTISSLPTSISNGEDNDNNTIMGNTIKKVRYGLYFRGGSAINPNTGTVISNNTFGPTAFGAEAIGKTAMVIREEDGIQITGNNIGFIGGDYATAYSTGTDRAGIALATDATWTPTAVYVKNAIIKNNIIHDIIDERTFSAIGIIVGVADGSNPTSNLIANNVFYNLKANGTSTDKTIGIGINAGNSDSIVFNSIYLTGDTDPNGSATTPSESNFGIQIASTSVTNPVLRNNAIFMDLSSSSAPTLKNACIYVPASYTWGTGSSNYNDFYVNAGNAQSNVGAVSTTFHLTLSAWQTAVTQDANSISADPAFNSTTNLRPLPGTPLINAGTPISGITTDNLGVTRNVTTPTIGAYEQSIDVTGPAISYTQITGPTLCATAPSLSATITDISGVNTTVGTKPRLYYKKSTDANTYAGNASGNNGWKYVEASNAASPFNFTMDFSLLQAPATGGDTIQYFVVAQDLVMTPNVGIHSGTFQVTPASVALTAAAFPIGGTINKYAIVAGGLATDVTIGAAGTYTTLTGAGGLFAAINSSGLLANITATILDATVAETGVNSLNEIIYGCGGPYTLTVKPASGVTTVLSGSVTTPLINFNGADRVKFDGSNNGTSSMNMTIRNTSATSAANTIRFINGSTFDTLENVIIEGAITSTTNGVVLFSTTTGSTGNSNNVIDNCHIRDRSDLAGIPTNTLYGSGTGTLPNSNNVIVNSNLFNFSSSGINLSSTGLGNNWQINNCNIYNAQTPSSASTQNGILIAGGTGHTISENAVGGSGVGAAGTWTNTGNVIITGISLTGGVANISNNTVANISGTSTGTTARIRGIANTSGGLDGVVIDSNQVFNLLSSGAIASYTGGSQPVIGIYVFPGTTWYVSTISNNEIHDLSAENTFVNTTSNMAVGLLLTNWRGQCFNNKIYNIRNKATGVTANQPPIATGIYARFFSQGAVYNNMISIGHGETNNVQYNGIQIVGAGESGNQQYYYHNSIHVGGTGTGTFGSHAFLRGDNSTTSPSHPVDLKNNILSMIRTGGGAVNYAIASQGTNADTLWVSDYNDLYNSVAANIGYWFATGYDFANWQSNTGQDANSISVAPMFVSDTDLHLTLANTGIDNEGTPVLGVTTDFDGTVRNILTPDIGAHEIITSGCSKFITSGADSGAGTLRDAVACAQSGEQLIVDPSVALITLTSGEIDLNKTLIITGHGIDDLSLSGNASSRIFRLQASNFLQLEDMTLTNATSVTNGGAFWAQDDMTLKNVRIENSTENGTPKGYTADPGTLIEFIGSSFINN